MKQVAGQLKGDLAQFRELAAFAQFGSEVDAKTQAQIDRGRRIVEIFKQPQYSPVPVEVQVAVMWVVQNGYMDDVPVERVRECQAKLTDFLTTRKAELLARIGREKALSDALTGRAEGRRRAVQAGLEVSPRSERLSHAEPARNPPTHPVDQQHRPDHPGDADGGGVEDAQGAGGGAGRTSLRPAPVPDPARRRRRRRSSSTRCSRSARSGSAAVVLVGADKGLCGALNSNVLRVAAQYDPASTVFVTAGRRAAQFVARTGRQLAAEFAYGDNPTFAEARAIAGFARDLFLKREVDEVLVVATRFVNTLTQEPGSIEFLPVGEIKGLKIPGAESEAAATADADECLFEPDAESVLGFLLGALSQHLHLPGPAEREGQRAERAHGVDEERHGQRRGPHQGPDPRVQQAATGQHHEGAAGDRGRPVRLNGQRGRPPLNRVRYEQGQESFRSSVRWWTSSSPTDGPGSTTR